MMELLKWCMENDYDFTLEKIKQNDWILTISNKKDRLNYSRIIDMENICIINDDKFIKNIIEEFSLLKEKRCCDYYSYYSSSDTYHCNAVKGAPIVKCDGNKKLCEYYKGMK